MNMNVYVMLSWYILWYCYFTNMLRSQGSFTVYCLLKLYLVQRVERFVFFYRECTVPVDELQITDVLCIIIFVIVVAVVPATVILVGVVVFLAAGVAGAAGLGVLGGLVGLLGGLGGLGSLGGLLGGLGLENQGGTTGHIISFITAGGTIWKIQSVPRLIVIEDSAVKHACCFLCRRKSSKVMVFAVGSDGCFVPFADFAHSSITRGVAQSKHSVHGEWILKFTIIWIIFGQSTGVIQFRFWKLVFEHSTIVGQCCFFWCCIIAQGPLFFIKINGCHEFFARSDGHTSVASSVPGRYFSFLCDSNFFLGGRHFFVVHFRNTVAVSTLADHWLRTRRV